MIWYAIWTHLQRDVGKSAFRYRLRVPAYMLIIFLWHTLGKNDPLPYSTIHSKRSEVTPSYGKDNVKLGLCF